MARRYAAGCPAVTTWPGCCSVSSCAHCPSRRGPTHGGRSGAGRTALEPDPDRRGPGLGATAGHRLGHRGRRLGLRRRTAAIRRSPSGFRGGDDSWYDPWNGTRSPTDQGGHGTHTLATAVGRDERRRRPRRPVDRLRQPRPQPRQPGALPGLPAVHAGPVPDRRRPVRRRPAGPGAAGADQLVGLPADRGLRRRGAPAGHRRLRRGRHLLRRRRRQHRSGLRLDRRPAGAVPGCAAPWARWTGSGGWPRSPAGGRRPAARPSPTWSRPAPTCCRRCRAAGTPRSAAPRWPPRTWRGWWR